MTVVTVMKINYVTLLLQYLDYLFHPLLFKCISNVIKFILAWCGIQDLKQNSIVLGTSKQLSIATKSEPMASAFQDMKQLRVHLLLVPHQDGMLTISHSSRGILPFCFVSFPNGSAVFTYG